MDVRVAGSNAKNISVSFAFTPAEINIQPLLLNPGDEFVIEILVSGGPPSLRAQARIAGIRELSRETRTRPGKTPDKRDSKLGVVYLIDAYALLFVATLIWISRASSPLARPTPLASRMGWALFSLVILLGASALALRRGTDVLGLETGGPIYWVLLAGVFAAGMLPIALAAITEKR